MQTIFLKNKFYISKQNLAILFICLVSRLPATIFYIEDIDSLRFALSAVDYNVLESRPHFPAYPVYCFGLIIIYNIVGNIGIAFSIIGALSIYLIIHFSRKIWRLYSNKSDLALILIILLNPLLWLLSNRYMPDIFGLALLMAGLYYFIAALKFNQKKHFILLGIIVALEIGVRLSFIPFFIPVAYLLTRSKVKYTIVSFVITCLAWFIPLALKTGFQELINVSQRGTSGHFYDWGGTIMSSDTSPLTRLIRMFEFIFVDGFSFWTLSRNWLVAINSVFLSCFLVMGTYIIIKYFKKRLDTTFILVSLAFICYAIWVYFFQNISYKSRHIIPFIPVICFVIALGISNMFTKRQWFRYAIVATGFTVYATISIILVTQHKSPSALSQINDFLYVQPQKTVVLSNPLKNYYWNYHKDTDHIRFINIENDQYTQLLQEQYEEGNIIYSTHNLVDDLGNASEVYNFYHNPHVNRLWSHLKLYKYEKD
ncbi:MAG: glycosyltransferase family 39 protein [Bacteroidota bacterium]